MKGCRPNVYLATVTIVLCIALAPKSYAQLLPSYPDVRLKNMPYKNSAGENAVTIFYYGRDGKLRSAVWKLADESRYSANFHLYDSDGNEVEKYREFSDGLTSTEKYEVDSGGRCTAEFFERSDGRKGTARFTWDDNGHLVLAELDNFRGWLSGRIAYSYDDTDRRDGASIERDGKNAGTVSYAYDSAGRLVEEHWDFGGQWSQTFNYEYEPRPQKTFGFSSPYVAMNAAFRVVNERYEYNNEGGGPSSYTYDDEGKLVEKVYERADGLKTITSYRYDQEGNLESSYRKYIGGLTADFDYEHDEARRLTKRTCRRSDGESGYEQYVYDRLGRLEKAVYNNMDFWLNGEIRFQYDGWGHIASGRFDSRDGNDADLTFETDAHGNVLKMHWMFETGKTQAYFFEYEPIR
jgi:YD repeat-containing protein